MVKTILVCDKDLNMLEAFNRFFSQEDYRVLTTESLEEAAKVIGVVRVDLIIIDIGKSPEYKVLEGLSLIGQKNEDIPIILTANYSDTLTEKRARQLGAVHFMLKPFDPAEMKCVVRKLVEKGLGH